MEVGRGRPPGNAVVQPALKEPGRVLGVAVEPVAGHDVPRDVMDRPQPVVRAANGAVQSGVQPFAVDSRRGYLKHPRHADRVDQLGRV
jgi:hypothetical protein